APSGCAGFTGAVTRVRNGHQKRVVTGLASLAGSDGGFATGGDDMAVQPDGTIFVIMTSAGPGPLPPGAPPEFKRQLGNLLAFENGHERKVADIDNFEFANDPDHEGVDSDPYGVYVGPAGKFVVDAAGNDLLAVNHGNVSLVA